MPTPAKPLLACVLALVLAGCSATPVGTQEDRTETFTLSPRSTVASVKTIEFEVHFKGDLRVHANSTGGPVLVVLQHKKDCGSFAEQAAIPGSRYERHEVDFTYYVPDRGDYCLAFQNRNGEPIDVTVTVTFP